MRPEILAPGQVVAEKFRIDRLLGSGGMSAVYQCFHLGLEQPIALKVLLPKLAANEQFVARFLREAKAAAKIRGEHVGRVLDVGTWNRDGAPFIALELLEGEDLSVLLQRRGRLDPSEAVDLVIQACDGLARAHAVGVIHRDVKPANLFVTTVDGEPCVKVIDFGVAKQTTEDVTQLTNTSEVFGSPQYMSPEQIRASKHVDLRTDVWAIGCVLYELLAGAPPFTSPSLISLTSLVISEPTPPLSARRPEVSAGLEAIVLRCLEKRPEQRWSSVIDLAIALEPFGRSNARVVESLRRLKVHDPSRAAGSAVARSSMGSVPSLSVAPTSTRAAAPTKLSPKIMLVTGAATFALVLLIVFLVDRVMR